MLQDAIKKYFINFYVLLRKLKKGKHRKKIYTTHKRIKTMLFESPMSVKP